MKNARKEILDELTAERVEAIPALKSFMDAAERSDLKSGAGFFGCLPALKELAQSHFLTDLVNHELAKILDQPSYVPVMSFESQTIILRRDSFELSIGLVNDRSNPPNARVDTLGGHCMLTILPPEGIDVELYRGDGIPANDLFDKNHIIESRGKRRYEPGDIILIEAGSEAIRFYANDRDVLVLNFSSTPFLDYIWEYDTNTSKAVRFVPTDVMRSRIDYALWFLAEMNSRGSIPLMSSIAKEHPAHFIRWSAIQAIGAMDTNAALPLLEDAKADSHPHVRRAAERAISLIGASALSA